MNYIAYLFTAASILGTVANSLQKRWCFWVWLCTNFFWCIYNTVNGQYAQTLLYVFNLITCIVGLVKWRQINSATGAAKETIPQTDSGETQPAQQKPIQKPPEPVRRPLSFWEWLGLKDIKAIKNRALKHKKHRTRKKNRARFWRELNKYRQRSGRV